MGFQGITWLASHPCGYPLLEVGHIIGIALLLGNLALLRATQLPTRRDRRWHVELAPLSRLQAWKVPPLKDGDAIALLGFTFAGEKEGAILRAECLFAGGKAYGLRSSPA